MGRSPQGQRGPYGVVGDVEVVNRAARALPRPDVQRHRLLDGPALRAQFRGGEPPIDLGQVAAVSGRLVLQHSDELRPARIMHGLRKAGTAEAGHGKVLHVHRLVLADDLSGELVSPVAARVGHPGVRPGDRGPGFGPVRAALGFAVEIPLCSTQVSLGAAQETRVVHLPAIASDGEVRVRWTAGRGKRTPVSRPEGRGARANPPFTWANGGKGIPAHGTGTPGNTARGTADWSRPWNP